MTYEVAHLTATEGSTIGNRFHLYSVEELLELPTPQWLIEDVMETNAFAVLYGPSGTGKTFIALDWALSVATGTAWLGHATRRGPIVYVAAEGGRSVQKRVRAWVTHRQHAEVDGYFVIEPVQLRESSDLEALLRQVERRNLQPSLIIIDTLARCFVGGEENSANDVGQFVEACRELGEATGATIVVVHHTGKTGDTERGSSALRAAADIMVEVRRRTDGTLEIRNDKQKDEAEFEPIRARLNPIPVGRDTVTERALTSCVVEAASPDGARNAPTLPPGASEALGVLRGFPGGLAPSADWRLATGLSETTFHRYRRDLVQAGLVRKLTNPANHYQVATDTT
jgi:hypothetical protein